jgi:hypothetical protein
MGDIVIHKVNEIMNRLSYAIVNKKSFGLIRFGDGTIKAIHSFLNNDYDQMNAISKQEGIPKELFERIIEFWKTSANYCDYIDSPEVYFTKRFWKRTKNLQKNEMSKKTIIRLKEWEQLYNKIGITNKNYCNPEINFLFCIISNSGFHTLPDILKYKKICIVTTRSDVKEKLKKYDMNIDIIKIVGKFEDQYHNSFNEVIQKIDDNATNYDLWLIAAGELGRIYPGFIKFKGGRAFDIGSLIDVWCGDDIPSRLKPYLIKTIHYPLKFSLTENGKEYLKYL